MKNIKILNHPVAQHYLTIMRDKDTDLSLFKSSLDKISYLLAAEVYSDLSTERKTVITPLKKTTGSFIKNKIVLLPILRAGLGLTKGFTDLYPDAVTSHIGIFRNEESLKPVKYYFKFPKMRNIKDITVIVLDPMIATGGSVIFTIEYLLHMGIKKIKIASLLAAPEGINAINERFRKSDKKFLDIYTCSLDESLNEKGYIVPGLGDAGDRMFGT